VLQRLLAQGVPATPANLAAEKAAVSETHHGPDKPYGGYAEGGPLAGPGTGTSDSILLRGSVGEYMQRRAAVDYYGVQAMDDINAKRIPRSVLRGYAGGGLLFPVNTDTHWPFRVNMGNTFVPSQQQAITGFARGGEVHGGASFSIGGGMVIKLSQGDIAALASAIGAVIAGILAGSVPAARSAARQIGKRPR